MNNWDLRTLRIFTSACWDPQFGAYEYAGLEKDEPCILCGGPSTYSSCIHCADLFQQKFGWIQPISQIYCSSNLLRDLPPHVTHLQAIKFSKDWRKHVR